MKKIVSILLLAIVLGMTVQNSTVSGLLLRAVLFWVQCHCHRSKLSIRVGGWRKLREFVAPFTRKIDAREHQAGLSSKSKIYWIQYR